jgi:hypothetical protein
MGVDSLIDSKVISILLYVLACGCKSAFTNENDQSAAQDTTLHILAETTQYDGLSDSFDIPANLEKMHSIGTLIDKDDSIC